MFIVSKFFLARLGVVQSLPGLSCKDIKDSNEDSATGEYWIDPTISNDSFTVFCDMQTDGGNYCILVDERVTGGVFPTAFPPQEGQMKGRGNEAGLEGRSVECTRRNMRN